MSTEKRAQSARTLLWLSGTLIAIGLVVLSKAAMFLCMVTAAVVALAAVPLGTRRSQVIALVLLALSAGLAIQAWPGFLADQQRYREANRAPKP